MVMKLLFEEMMPYARDCVARHGRGMLVRELGHGGISDLFLKAAHVPHPLKRYDPGHGVLLVIGHGPLYTVLHVADVSLPLVDPMVTGSTLRH